MKIVTGVVIMDQNKILMVQEKRDFIYEKWSLPIGSIEESMDILEKTIQETYDEAGCVVTLTGILDIHYEHQKNELVLALLFDSKLIEQTNDYKKDEIIQTKWLDVSEVLENMDEDLRNPNLFKKAIQNKINNKIISMEMISMVK